jgi:tRNA dimethylallyltransferase
MANILILAGPTASGKSPLALALAERLGGGIINADSMQVYTPYPLLSAQPDNKATQARVPHHLYSYVAPPAFNSAASWRSDAEKSIHQILSEKRLPILVGGTGLYLETLMHGLSDIPDIEPALRQQARQEYETLGGEAFLKKMMEIDPPTASRLHASDRQRLIRAYEVYLATNKPLSFWQARKTILPPSDWSFISILMLPKRDFLYSTIEKRFQTMLQGGALEEISSAQKLQISDEHPVKKTLGVRELEAVLEGKIKLEAATAKASQSTRNYAKRQYTWFKNRYLKKEKALSRPILILEGGNALENLELSESFFAKAAVAPTLS